MLVAGALTNQWTDSCAPRKCTTTVFIRERTAEADGSVDTTRTSRGSCALNEAAVDTVIATGHPAASVMITVIQLGRPAEH